MAHRAKHVFRWDLDKTYLRSEFETMRDLVKSALEPATEKQAFPGAPALLRALRRGVDHRICIVSGSPTQMRRVLATKLALDGIEYDEFVLKNNWRNLYRLRFRALRAQVPYKLPALLESRAGLVGTPPETLFGDDAEADAIVYSLYADVLSGVITRSDLEQVLHAARAYDDQIERILALAARVRPGDCVSRILIHLDQRSPTATFAPFGRRLTPIYNYFQAALLLYADDLLSARQVVFVAEEMLESRDYSLPTLANSFQDLLRRGRLSTAIGEKLSLEIQSGAAKDVTVAGIPVDQLAWSLAERVRSWGGAPPLEWPAESPRLDYVSLVDAEYQRRRKS